MADLVRISFKGGKQLSDLLLAMERKPRRNAMTRAMRGALNPFKYELQQKIKSSLTNMDAVPRALFAKQLYISFKVEKNDSIVGRIRTRNKVIEVPQLGNRGRVNFSKLAHIFEGGAKPHKIRQPKRNRTINHPGIRSIPLWEQTLKQHAESMTKQFHDRMFREIAIEWRKGK